MLGGFAGCLQLRRGGLRGSFRCIQTAGKTLAKTTLRICTCMCFAVNIDGSIVFQHVSIIVPYTFPLD